MTDDGEAWIFEAKTRVTHVRPIVAEATQ